MTSVLKKLTAVQSSNVVRLISALRTRAGVSPLMNAGLTDKNGLLAFYAYSMGLNVSFSEPYGSAPIMLFNGGIVTAANVRMIASAVNSYFGPGFYSEVLENGQSANVEVSVANDVIPHIEAYQARHDRELPIRKKKIEREQVRSLIKIAENPASDAIKKNIPCTTLERWRTLEKKLTTELVDLESFS